MIDARRSTAARMLEAAERDGLVVDRNQQERQACLRLSDDMPITISIPGGPSVETTLGGLKAARADASNLAATIDRARSLFSEGDYQNALWLSEAVYDQSKAAASYAKRMKLSDELIGKARRMQGDALLIETRAKMALADQFDEAQKAGVVATPGRPKKVSDENLFRLEDVGLSKGQVHEARKLRDAETKEPGLVERAIAARIQAGLEPSRANLRAAVGTASASKEDRGDNFYQTPIEATRTLLAYESFSGTIWESSCGLGAISRAGGGRIRGDHLRSRRPRHGD
jgi:hypothetical protein